MSSRSPTAPPTCDRLDFWLPRFDFRETHSMPCDSTAERAYREIETLDMGSSLWVRVLFRLRGLPANALRFGGLTQMGFVPLEERPFREIVLGLVGRFWTPRGGILKLQPAQFSSFDKPGYAKVVWNFAVSGDQDGPVLLTTETRIQCTDPVSRRWFRFYWLLVRPFSGSIRRSMLRRVRRKAEVQHSG